MVTKNSEPTVSVIIPTYNRAHLLPQVIDYVLKQTFKDIELIIVNDGSTDKTEDVIKEFKDERIRYIKHNKKMGGQAARNTGMRLVRGEFIQFLDSDDYITSDKIQVQVEALKNSDYSCAICDFKYTDSKGSFDRPVKNDGNIHDYVARFRSVFISTPLIRKSSLLPGLIWDERIKRNQDMDFMFKYFMSITNWIYTPGFYCLYIQHADERISDDYHIGVQCYELYKSMKRFVDNNISYIPKENLWLLNEYRNRLLKIFLMQLLRKISSSLDNRCSIFKKVKQMIRKKRSKAI